MPYSLTNHLKDYQISNYDICITLATGFSGIPFAYRHYELSKVESNWLYHRLILLIECVPLLGGLVAIVERIVHSFFKSNFTIPWREAPVSQDLALKKMIKNEQKGLKEHIYDHHYNQNPHAQAITGSDSVGKKESTPLKITTHFADAQGPRPTMEDARFFMNMEKGTLVGIFDGHGGKEVSAFASQEYQKLFPEALKEFNGNVHQALEAVTHKIHKAVAANSAWNTQGCTQVVTYIDHETHTAYTSTLGDSEVNVYRNGKSIPLSPIRNWNSKQDRARLMAFHGKENVPVSIARGIAKHIRSHINYGTNVSRAIGDLDETGTIDKPLVIHKPKITAFKLQPGDILVLACDGLKDYVQEDEIVNIVKGPSLFQKVMGGKEKPVAQRLVDAALSHMTPREGDNVTVVAVEIK